ncbi:MAG: DUF2199 domain-containing protein [Chitinophagales bacterium]|nr:DUF2199 domain-containing protein [Chitinophagaceae bacterium]MCB9064829.1 DUF2199 domain-containing protein [Chitinophagales bacterium]
MKYLCSICGKEHEEWPAIAWTSPTSYNELTDVEKNTCGELSEDYCIIRYPDQTDYFIRAVLIQDVTDNCQNLDYGVWVSLSEKSFEDYRQRHNTHEDREATYFGYLNTIPPEYDFINGIKTNVVVSNGINRPEVIPHQSDQDQIPFIQDYFNGITTQEALNRIKQFDSK